MCLEGDTGPVQICASWSGWRLRGHGVGPRSVQRAALSKGSAAPGLILPSAHQAAGLDQCIHLRKLKDICQTHPPPRFQQARASAFCKSSQEPLECGRAETSGTGVS